MKRFVVMICVSVLFPVASYAKFAWERDPVFLSKSAIPIQAALSPPPSAHSEVDRADFEKLFEFQSHRSPADCARAGTEVNVSLDSFFGPKYGPLTRDEVKAWSPFFEKVRIDTDFFVQQVKRQWIRPRPYVANSKIAPCVRRELTGAYPSGHAAIARVFARVLEIIKPDQKQVIEQRANQVSQDRILAGVHHPSDIAAGQKLGDEVFEALQKNTQFQKELREIQSQH